MSAIDDLRQALAEFDKHETVRYLWPVLDAARTLITEHDEGQQ